MADEQFEVEVVGGVLNAVIRVLHRETGCYAITSCGLKPTEIKEHTADLKKRLTVHLHNPDEVFAEPKPKVKIKSKIKRKK